MIKNLNKVIDELKKSIDNKKIIIDPDKLKKFSRDETSDLSGLPDLAVIADSVNDISVTLKICNKYRIPVIPRGSGTGVTGGAVPSFGGIVLSLERMNRIIEIDRNNMFAVVEPGVITSVLQNAVNESGLMYPPDPASLDSCSIGGNVAEGAGGPRAVKYGTTRDYVTGLEFVLSNGDIIHTGGKIVKNATGYNLIGILIGSEGTLAVITKIFLKLIPAPAKVTDIMIPFDTIDEALGIIPVLLRNKIIPSTIEFMEEDAIRLVNGFYKGDVLFGNAGAHLLIQIDGNSDEEILSLLTRINEVLSIKNEVIVADSKNQRERIWKIRRSIRDAVKDRSSVFFGEDTVVPRSSIPDFIKDIKQYLRSENIFSVIFGHAGDGNVHINILKDNMDYDKWKDMMPVIKNNIYKMAVSYGGTLTGEHGIGLIKKDYIGLAISEEGIRLSKRIKDAFDPENILNPGKIF